MGIIYKIVNNVNGDIYIGSSKFDLEKRKYYHKKHYKAYLEGKHNYVSSFDIFKDENYEYFLLSTITDNKDLKIIEQTFINAIKCINKNKAHQTHEEMKEVKRRYREKWVLENPNKMINYQRKRDEKITCECGSNISKRNLSRHKRLFCTIKCLKC